MEYERPGRVLTREEVRRVLDYCSNWKGTQAWRRKVVAGTLLRTGLRISELRQLARSDCLQKSSGVQSARIVVRKGKGGKRRIVLAADEVVADLIAIAEGGGPCFASPRHPARPLAKRTLQRDVDRVLEECGCPGYRVHDLRHTYATYLYLAAGRDMTLIQRQLGHASSLTTTIYIASLLDDVIAALDNLYSDV